MGEKIQKNNLFSSHTKQNKYILVGTKIRIQLNVDENNKRQVIKWHFKQFQSKLFLFDFYTKNKSKDFA